MELPKLYDLHANKVVSFSSQYGKENSLVYTATNLSKPPHYCKFPAYGDFETSYLMRTYGSWWKNSKNNIKNSQKTVFGFISKDYIELQYEKRLFLKSVCIYETYHPGSVCALYAYSYRDSKWVKLWTIFENNRSFKTNQEALKRQLPSKRSRKLVLDVEDKYVYTDLIRLEFEDFGQDYYSEFDAVIISGYEHEVVEKIVGQNLNKLCELFTYEDDDEDDDELENEINLVDSLDLNIAKLVDMPQEIFHLIFKNLDLISILKLRSTCKILHKICSDKLIFLEIDLQPYWYLVNNSLLGVIKNLADQTTFLNLSWTKDLNVSLLKGVFIASQYSLTILRLACCQFVDDDVLQVLCLKCSRLQELDLQSCENINEFLPISNLFHLKKLNLYRTNIKTSDLGGIIRSCTQFDSLNIGSCVQIDNCDWILQQIATYNPFIKSLDFWRASSIIDTGLANIANACSTLEELDIGWCKLTNHSSLHVLFQSNLKLQKLFLTRVRITDAELDLISKNMHDLEQLDILGSGSVSAEAIEKRKTSMKSMELIVHSNVDIFSENSKKHQFANKVVQFSSQYGREQGNAYTASNIAKGALDIYPKYGDFKEAFVLRTYGPWWLMSNSNMKNSKKTIDGFISKDFVEVTFPQSLFIEEIEIYETYNPGAVVVIYAYNYLISKWIQIWSLFDKNHFKNNDEALKRSLPSNRCVKFCPELKNNDFKTDKLRLEFNDFGHEYYTEIDGIATVGYTNKIGSSHTVKEANIIELDRQESVTVDEKTKNIFDLPIEIMNLIIQNLNLIDFLKLSQTCKLFQKVCMESNIFYETDLQPYWNIIDENIIRSFSGFLKRATSINLSWTKSLSLNAIESLFQNSTKTLTTLRLSCCDYLNLEILEFICFTCTELKELDLQSCENITDFQSIGNLKNLTKLNLYRTKISSFDLAFILSSNINLEYLNIGSCNNIEDIEDVLQEIERSKINLKGLDLWRCGQLNRALDSIAESCSNLEELDIGWCKCSFDSLIHLIQSCKKLKKLFLTALRIQDSELEAISMHLPELEMLDILGSSSVSKQTVEKALVNCKKMKFFDLSFCTTITNFGENVQDLKTKFPNCTFKSSYQET